MAPSSTTVQASRNEGFMSKTGREKMREWFVTATPPQLQWARNYLPGWRHIELAVGPANDPKAVLVATVELHPREDWLRHYTSMTNAWRQYNRRQNIPKTKKGSVHTISPQAQKQLMRLAGQQPLNKTLEQLIEAGFRTQQDIKEDFTREKAREKERQAAARRQVTGQTKVLRETIKYQESVIELLRRHLDHLLQESSNQAALLKENNLTGTTLSPEQSDEASRGYGASKQAIDSALKQIPMTLMQHFGPYAGEAGQSPLQK